MRAILDSNVLVSYLLANGKEGSIGGVIGLVFGGRIYVALPSEQIEELRHAVATKPFLRERIGLAGLELFFELMATIGEILPPLEEDPPRVLRDRKDDFLIESARQNKIGLIVSGDRDLLDWSDAPPYLTVIAPAQLEQYLTAREVDQS